MRCPECLAPMTPVDWQGVEVDVCRNCRGLWFDHGELELVSPTEPTGNTSRLMLSRGCPRCHTRLRRRDYLTGGVPVDLCPACHGMYLSLDGQRQVERLRGAEELHRAPDPELDRIAAYYDQQIDRDLTIWDWLFQFFTQLPIEINVPPRRAPVVNWGLIALNAAIFLVAWPRLEAAIDATGLFPAHLLAGQQPWRLISSMFMHGGWAHLIGNLYFLHLMGDNVEDQLGRSGYLLFYLACGLAAAATMVALNPDMRTPMVGASGAISGVIGAYLVACPKARLTLMIVIFQIKMPAWVSLWGWAIVQVLSWSAGVPGVAWEAHLGGFFAGLIGMSVIRGKRAARVAP